MSLSAGSRVGPYEIHSAIGAGGMGEVYRARDTRLDRDVALKVLPELFAADPERLARFEREAKTLAALNHPHIAQIYGVEKSDGVFALAMELIEGEDLADRIARGAIPVSESLEIARQIAEALEAAHEQGIIHRDLKPANVKLRIDGTVKVLDFGLAKALDRPGAGSAGVNLANSPTLTSPLVTSGGMIIGTAAYMSPEQARGKPVDKRADIWAFGVVLVEMLTGRSVFAGETVSDTLAHVLERDPDWDTLPAALPPRIGELLARCLMKDARQRLRDIGEARVVLSDPHALTTHVQPVAVRGSSRWLLALVSVLSIALAGTGVALWNASRPASQTVIRYSVLPPSQSSLTVLVRPALALSPEGSTLVFAASTAGVTRLYVRTRDALDAKPIPGTEGATNPVISPDGRWVAFNMNDIALKKVAIGGGAVIALASAYEPRGISWDSDDTITFTPQATGGVFQVSANGGEPRALTTVDASKGERTHRWPQMLPGNRAVLFTVGNLDSADSYDAATIEAVEIASGKRHVLITGARAARYVPTGHLLYARGSTVYAVEFDAASLQVRGGAAPVLEDVAGDTTTGAIHLTVANDGTLAYLSGSASVATRLAWVARDGRVEPLDPPVGMYLDPAISRDGKRAAITNLIGGASAIWVYDFARRAFTRLTFGSDSAITPIWSYDGRTIYYVVGEAKSSRTSILKIPADGGKQPQPLTFVSASKGSAAPIEERASLHWVSRDEQTALVAYRTRERQSDIGMVSLADGKMTTLVSTPFDEFSPHLSGDGRWLAYQSNETGRYEIFVRDLAAGGGRWQVTTNGGEEPHWSADGRELYYRIGDQMVVVPTTLQPTFTSGTSRTLFRGVLDQMRLESNLTYAVAPEGERLLMVWRASEDLRPRDIRVVINWFSELQRQARSQ